MRKILLALASITWMATTHVKLAAQTPYDDFAPSGKPKPILTLPTSIFRVDNIDTAAAVKYLLFEKESSTLLYVGQNDSVIAFETLQAREMKWWSVDPLANEAPGIGPYTFVDDNPIANVDPDGRKTLYYSESGVLLFTSNDNLPDAISIVNDSEIKQFVKQYYFVNFSQDVIHTDEFNKGLRSLSMNYMVDGMIELQTEAINTPLPNPDLYRDPVTNLPMQQLVPEVVSYLYDDGNGNISVGPERYVGTPRDHTLGPNLNPNPAARIHTHNNNKGDSYVHFAEDGKRLGQVTLDPYGPSEKDVLNSNYKDKYYDVVVDPQYINLHGGPGNDIQVPISVFQQPNE